MIRASRHERCGTRGALTGTARSRLSLRQTKDHSAILAIPSAFPGWRAPRQPRSGVMERTTCTSLDYSNGSFGEWCIGTNATLLLSATGSLLGSTSTRLGRLCRSLGMQQPQSRLTPSLLPSQAEPQRRRRRRLSRIGRNGERLPRTLANRQGRSPHPGAPPRYISTSSTSSAWFR